MSRIIFHIDELIFLTYQNNPL